MARHYRSFNLTPEQRRLARAEANRRYRRTHAEAIRAYMARYFQENKTSLVKAMHAWRHDHAEAWNAIQARVRSKPAYRARVSRQHRLRYKTDPVYRAHRLAASTAWIKAHLMDPEYRARHNAASAKYRRDKYNSDQVYRVRQLKREATWRRAHRKQVNEYQRAWYQKKGGA
jgi:hypothetical protein